MKCHWLYRFNSARLVFLILGLSTGTASLCAQTNLAAPEILSDTTWSGTNLIQTTVTIASNVVLRVAPGAQILLASGATLVVRGRILAEGTEAAPIYFTRGDAGRGWKGIRLIAAQPSRFVHCIFEHADSEGTHLDYYDTDCNEGTPLPPRAYHEAIVAIASHVDLESCQFQNMPGETGSKEGDAIAIISDDPQNPGTASAHVNKCRFISIGQGIHSRFSYILVENSFFTDHRGDNDDVDMYGESTPPPMIRYNTFLNPDHDDMINPTRCSAIIIGNIISGGDDHGIVLRDKCRPIVMNNFISNCAAGGISVQNQCDALIANNTITDCGRGIRLFDHDSRWDAPYCLFPGSGRATVVNTIIWDCDESLTLTDSPSTVDRGSHVTILYSNIEGGRASASVSANSTLTWGEGNREVDPQFAIGMRLSPGSPMIDAGTNQVIAGSFSLPLDGDGNGLARLDIGAHEFLLEGADSNHDGIPDGWTARFGFYPAATNIAASDPDQDQHTTFQEWIADTDPTHAASRFQLLERPGGGLSFQTSTNRLYTVESTTNLFSATWIKLPTHNNTPGTGGPVSIAPVAAQRAEFYRVEVKALPSLP